MNETSTVTMATVARDLTLFMPESLLALGAMALLMAGVFMREGRGGEIAAAAIGILVLAILLILAMPSDRAEIFGGSFIMDPFATVMKVMALLATVATLVISASFAELERVERFEYPVLVMMSALGILLMISAGDLIALYMGVEMQSLALYVLAAWRRSSLRSSEAGLKYFVLGALSSGILLYGCSMIYGLSGTVSFAGIAEAEASPGLIVGMVFVLAGLAFKISAVPFHMWTPDVYEGAPTPVTLFLASAPKVAALALLCRFALEATPEGAGAESVLAILAVGSMVLGAVAAIGQSSVKRLLAYSSIGHMGYALIGLIAASEEGLASVVIYMAIYLVTVIGAFICILALREESAMPETLEKFAGLSQTQPLIAAILALMMLSLAGIPPLAGFFGKFYVFFAAIESGYVWLAVVGAVASVVASYYYLRIVKLIYFDEPQGRLVVALTPSARTLLIASGLFAVFFIFAPRLISEPAEWSARGFNFAAGEAQP